MVADPRESAWADAPQILRRPWRPVTIDIERPLEDIETSGLDALHVTVFAGPTPLGRVVIPTTTDMCTADRLHAYITRFDLMAFEDTILRQLDDPPGPSPSATVVICTRDRAPRLRECLAALSCQRRDVDEILVVHNSADDDGTEAVANEFGVRYVREPNLGLDRARNRGALEANTDIVIYTDDDVRVHPEWANRLLARFRDQQVVAVTGLLLPGELATAGQIEFEETAGFVRTFTSFVLDGTVTPPASAGRAGAGASMAFRRSFLERIGGFPESLDAGQPTKTGGDTYALYQALRHGHRVVFEPRAVAFHIHRTTPNDSMRAVHGYATGVVAYLLEAAIEDRSLAAATAAARWTRSRFAAFGRSLVTHPRARATRYVRTQVTGIVRAPGALRRARAASRRHPRLLEPGAESTQPIAPIVVSAAPRDTPLPSISVVIPTHGRRPEVVKVVEALNAQVYAGTVEIIVATDGPFTDKRELFDMIGAPLDCRVIVGSTGGPGAARNAGSDAATGDLLVFIDDDVFPAHEHVLAAHAAAHDGLGALLVIGPIQPVHDGESTLTLAARNWWSDQASRLHTATRLDFTDVCSGNLSIRRSDFLKLGGFRALPRQEDFDLGLRAIEAGYDLRAAPDASIFHNVDTTVDDSRTRRRLEGQGDVELVTQHPLASAGLRLGSWNHLTGWARRFATLAVRNPRAGDRLALALGALIGPLERVGSRFYLARIHQHVAALAYWSGVGERVGGTDGWAALRGSVSAARHAAPGDQLELLHFHSWEPPRIGSVGHISVMHWGVVLGEAPLGWGGIPFDKRRFGLEVTRRFSVAAIQVEAERAIAS